jgi:hypothetical protein
MMEDRLQDIADSCIERMLAGEPLERVLASHPEDAAVLMPLLQAAATLRSAPIPSPAPIARARAMERMLREAATVTPLPESGPMVWFASLRKGPPIVRGAALAGAAVIFGALAIGGSAAAGGGTPEPVRQIFGFSSSNAIKVELDGVVSSVEAETIVINAGGDLRRVTVTASTKLEDGDGEAFALIHLRAGDAVKVKGTLQPDNSIIATQVRLEDAIAETTDDDEDETPTTVPAVPVVPVEPEDDDQDAQSDDQDQDENGDASDENDDDANSDDDESDESDDAAGESDDAGGGGDDDDDAGGGGGGGGGDDDDDDDGGGGGGGGDDDDEGDDD